MEEVFQNYRHYSDWLAKNWNRNKLIDDIILSRGLIIEKQISLNGHPFRQLTRAEFDKIESNGFIKVPVLTQG